MSLPRPPPLTAVLSTAYNPSGTPPRSPRRTMPVVPDLPVQASTSQAPVVKGQALHNPHSLMQAMLATAFFRCWHFIVFFTVEAVIITYVQKYNVKSLAIQNTLMNVLGTVLGFVISYRSSSAFDRYNEGRKYWSQIVYNIRMFSRVVWYHIPDEPEGNFKLGAAKSVEEFRARTLVEKKTILNLLEGYAVALKHYLRGEEGSYYEDLYPLIKFLPAYALPAGYSVETLPAKHPQRDRLGAETQFQNEKTSSDNGLPLPASSLKYRTQSTLKMSEKNASTASVAQLPAGVNGNIVYLKPARSPPPRHPFDFWPLSLFVKYLTRRGKQLPGRKALREYARNRGINGEKSGNVPLEITLYLSSYIASMQRRGVDGFSCGQMASTLSQMVDALTGLERILTTPIPYSYAIHLWTVTLVWLLVLPFQILEPLGWLTIPGVALAAFVYCGLMKCAEELENPFGYDYNDLNMDHFTHNIIRAELQALTALPIPDPTNWAFSPDNDAVFDSQGNAIYLPDEDHPSPNEWVKRGEKDIRAALSGARDQTYSESISVFNAFNQPSGHGFDSPSAGGVIAAGAIAGATAEPEEYDFEPPSEGDDSSGTPVEGGGESGMVEG